MNFNIRQKKVIYAEEPKILCLATAACGKALPNSTSIPTPYGFKEVKDIKIGDFLIDRKGNPTKVLGVFPQGEKEIYKVYFKSGRVAECCEEHLWSYYTSNGKEMITKTTKEIYKESEINNFKINNDYCYRVPIIESVKLPKKELPINPYIMGLTLGDNFDHGGPLFYFISETEELPKKIAEILNYDLIQSTKNEFFWYFEHKENHNIISVEEILKNYLYFWNSDDTNKFIPEEYLFSSEEQRLELLRGLLDIRGYIKNNQGKIGYVTISEKMKDDFVGLASSLGFLTYCYTENYSGNTIYNIDLIIDDDIKLNLFNSDRKKNLIKEYLKDYNNKSNKDIKTDPIVKIEPTSIYTEMTCFYVDNEEHLFATERTWCITHNTRVLTERIRVLIQEKNVDPKDIVAITFTNLAAAEMRTRLSQMNDDRIKDMFIGTIHSYANSICTLHKIDTKSYIEREQYDEILKKAIGLRKDKFPHIKHVLIDECQDLSELEFSFLNKINTENIFYVGDNRQAIYGFRGCSDSHLLSMHKDASFKKYYLIENYRNAPNIISYAEDLLLTMPQVSPSSVAVKTKLGNIEECSFYEALEELEYSQNWGTWFILTRTNKELDEIMEILKNKKIPCITFKKKDLSPTQIDTIMKSNQVKVLTIHMSKGLENKNVIIVGARKFNIEERKIAYVGITRAENNLYWCPSITTRGRAYKKPSIFNHSQTDMVEF